GQPWFASTTSGPLGPDIASPSNVLSSPKSRLIRSIVTFGYFCSNSASSWSQILLTCPDSWSHTVSVIGPVSGMPVTAGAGGAVTRLTEPPGVQPTATTAATTRASAIRMRTRVDAIDTTPPQPTRLTTATVATLGPPSRPRQAVVRKRSHMV